jgi:hypothetical protein
MRISLTIIHALVFLTGCHEESERKPPFVFEKLVYHAIGKGCEGRCHTFHLSVDSSKNVKLYAERVYKNYDEIDRMYEKARNTKVDTVYPDSLLAWSRIGYFTGKVNDTTFNKLITVLKQVNLDSLEFPDWHCCDGIDKTLIVYYNNKRKTLWSMFPPDSTRKVFHTLNEIFHQDNFVRTDTFQLELRASR